MYQYLKKKKIYEIAQSLASEELPMCKDFLYTYSGGVEWLESNEFKITSQACGNWICIRHRKYDETRDEYVVDQDIFSHPVNGEYTYRSHNGKLIMVENIKHTEGQNYEQSNSSSKSKGWSEQDNYHSESRSRTR